MSSGAKSNESIAKNLLSHGQFSMNVRLNIKTKQMDSACLEGGNFLGECLRKFRIQIEVLINR